MEWKERYDQMNGIDGQIFSGIKEIGLASGLLEKLKKKQDAQNRVSQMAAGGNGNVTGSHKKRESDFVNHGVRHTAGTSGIVDYERNTITQPVGLGPHRMGQSHAVKFIDAVQQNIKGKTSGLNSRGAASLNPLKHVEMNKKHLEAGDTNLAHYYDMHGHGGHMEDVERDIGFAVAAKSAHRKSEEAKFAKKFASSGATSVSTWLDAASKNMVENAN